MGAETHDDVEFPSRWARRRPDHPAVIDTATGATQTYAQLEDRSRAVAHALWSWGLRPGDHLALVVSNRLEFYELCWAAHRIGLYYTAVNTHLTADEVRGIVADCGARVLVVDDALALLAAELHDGLPAVERRLAIGVPLAGYEPYEPLAAQRTGPLPHEGEGEKMLYTSGTTGTPKGVARPLTDGPPGSVFLIRPLMLGMAFDEHTVLMNPAPLYHSAPLGYGMGVHRLGGTVLITPRFDGAQCLEAMARYRATHGLFVPTHFIRMLRVPDRERYDLSALVSAPHAAAPCPPDVKRAMIDWWGPVLYEYYAGTEGCGMTLIDSAEWLAHPGSVGRPVSGGVHVVDEDDGHELPSGETGLVRFSGGVRFAYHGDDDKTASAYDERGWSTLGDIGHLDDEGYLYLTDRTAFTVISGGVNLYPQEVENALALHPLVGDVAAFGIPDDELGERLIAVVELLDPTLADDDTAAELADWCAQRLARQKCPRRIDFRAALPRSDSGKLYKRELVADYRAAYRSDDQSDDREGAVDAVQA